MCKSNNQLRKRFQFFLQHSQFIAQNQPSAAAAPSHFRGSRNEEMVFEKSPFPLYLRKSPCFSPKHLFFSINCIRLRIFAIFPSFDTAKLIAFLHAQIPMASAFVFTPSAAIRPHLRDISISVSLPFPSSGKLTSRSEIGMMILWRDGCENIGTGHWNHHHFRGGLRR